MAPYIVLKYRDGPLIQAIFAVKYLILVCFFIMTSSPLLCWPDVVARNQVKIIFCRENEHLKVFLLDYFLIFKNGFFSKNEILEFQIMHESYGQGT